MKVWIFELGVYNVLGSEFILGLVLGSWSGVRIMLINETGTSGSLSKSSFDMWEITVNFWFCFGKSNRLNSNF